MGVDVRDFNNPDDQINTFNNATVDVCKVGDQRVMRITAEPGWKWSNDVKPHVGTESCQTKHLGYIAQGTVCVKMDDGCLLYTSPSPRDAHESRMPSSA